MEQNTSVMNKMFLERVGTDEGKEKIAALGGDWVRDRLREESFMPHIFSPKSCKRGDPGVQISMNHDLWCKIVEVEPESRAMSMSFRGQPDATYFRGSRFEVPFFRVGSEKYEKHETELEVYTMPIFDIIKKNVVKDMQEIVDMSGLAHFEAACQAMQKVGGGQPLSVVYDDTNCFSAFNVDGGNIAEVGKVKGVDALANFAGADDTAGAKETLVYGLQKEDLTKLYKLFPGNGNVGTPSRLRCERILMTETDAEDLNSWSLAELGDAKTGAVTVDGWKYDTISGRKIVKTIKTDILRPGNIYGFTAPEFLGGMYTLGKTKFYVDKVRDKFSWEAWRDQAIYVANIAGVRKLELYCGAVELAGNLGVRDAYAPVSQANLGARNNRVDEGATFPQLTDF